MLIDHLSSLFVFSLLPIAKMAEDIGVNAITIHGRSVEQGYGGLPDLVKIREVAEAVKIPVIANGGIKNGAIAKEMLEQTRTAAIMPGRAVLGNPWLIDEILFHVDGRPIEHHRTIPAIKKTALEHFETLAQFYDERTACLCMRKFLSLYFTGVIGVLMMRKRLSDLNNRCTFISLLDQFDDQAGFIGRD